MNIFSFETTPSAENNPILNIGIFAAAVAVTLFIVIRASRNNKTAADYYAAGRSFTGPQNGFAISGDYLSAASFLGICGACWEQRVCRTCSCAFTQCRQRRKHVVLSYGPSG